MARNCYGDEWFNWYDEKETIVEAQRYIDGIWRKDKNNRWRFDLKVTDCVEDNDGWSVKVKVKWLPEEFWIDIWTTSNRANEEMFEDDMQYDWNECIFIESNYRDMLRKRVMDDSDFASAAFGLAADYVLDNYINPNSPWATEKRQ